MNLIKRLASEVKRNHWWTRQTRVVIGVSTGVDSMTLLYLLEHLRDQRPYIIVAHVNHELRAASKTEERYIRKYCARHHLKLVVAHWKKRNHPLTGTENAARKFRYGFFKRVMVQNDATVLLTAHHLNDQAETILMRLIRGGDIHELTGIHRCRRFANGYLIRPLLGTPKRDLRQFALDHHIKWYEDQTNYSLKITRNRMRHRLLPWMAREDSQVLFHIGDYVHQLSMLIRDNLALNAKFVEPLKTSKKNWWLIKPLRNYSTVVQWGLLHEVFYCFDPRLMITPPMMREIIQLLNDQRRPQGRIAINNRLQLQKVYHRFGVTNRKNVKTSVKETSFPVQANRWYRSLNGYRFGIFDKAFRNVDAKRFKLNLVATAFPLIVRSSRPSDKLRLRSGGHQKVRRIWIDKKITDQQRYSSQILETKHGLVLALLGLKTSVTKALRGTKPYWLIVKRVCKRG